MTDTTTAPDTKVAWQAGREIIDGYERHLVPKLFEPWGRRLVEHVAPQPGERVLDVACGTGIIARLAADRVGTEGSVTGVDLLPPMLAVAADVCAEVRPPIEWREADAASLPLPDESVDVVLCQQGLQFFADQPASLGEMLRVTRLGGRLAVSVWRGLAHLPGYAALVAALEPHSPAGAGFIKAVASLADAGELRGLLEGAGWADVRIVIDVVAVRYASAGDFVREMIEIAPVPDLHQLDAGARAHIVAQVETALASYTDDEGVTFPMEAHVAVARH